MTATAELAGDHVELTCPPGDRELVECVPGARWLEDAGRWGVPLTWGACQALRGVFGDRLAVGPGLRAWAKAEKRDRVAPCMALRDAEDAAGTPDLWPRQRVGSRFLRLAGGALLADDMGGGKTRQVVDALGRLVDEEEHCLPALIVSPMSVKRQWRDELAARLPHLRVAVVPSGPVGKRREVILSGADVVLVHWDQLPAHSRLAGYGSTKLARCERCTPKAQRDRHAAAAAKHEAAVEEHGAGSDEAKAAAKAAAALAPATEAACEAHEKELNQVAWRMIVADEAHRMCNPENKWTRALWWLGDHGSAYRWALSGTPMEGSEEDLWPILHWIAPEEWPSKSKYVERYLRLGYAPWGGINVVGLRRDTEAEFRSIFESRYLRRPLAEIAPQVPEPVYQERRVELPAKLRKPYDALAKEGVAWLDGDQLVAWDPLTELTRLTQLASAHMTVADDGRWVLAEPSPKVDELLVLLAELGHRQVVVAAESRQLIEMASRRLDKARITHGLITGTVSEGDREAAVDAFNGGEARCLLLTMGAGGEGLNLTAADTLVYLQRSMSMKKNLQTKHRIVRPGAERHDRLLVVDIVSADTVEEANLSRHDRKVERFERVFRDKERLRRLLTEHVVNWDTDQEAE